MAPPPSMDLNFVVARTSLGLRCPAGAIDPAVTASRARSGHIEPLRMPRDKRGHGAGKVIPCYRDALLVATDAEIRFGLDAAASRDTPPGSAGVSPAIREETGETPSRPCKPATYQRPG